MEIRRIDHSFLLLHLQEIVHLHTICFEQSQVWRECWTDYPTPGRSDNSLDYLIQAAGDDTVWVAAVDDGEVLGRPGGILACGIVERLSEARSQVLGIEHGGAAGRIFYNRLYFHHPRAVGHGLARRLVRKRIEVARAAGGSEIWCRTRKDHVKMDGMLRRYGFHPMIEVPVTEAGRSSVRILYRKIL